MIPQLDFSMLTNSTANALGIFSPVITLFLFAMIAKYRDHESLDAETAFTSVALLAMVTHPANMVMTIMPRAVASLANFERVQEYLTRSFMQDDRSDIKEAPGQNNDITTEDSHGPAIVFDNVTLNYASASEPTLTEINLTVKRGSIMMCSGRVGSGKTTLAKAILSETILACGTISVCTKRIGLCSQVPWLPSASIKQIVCGSSANVDLQWYDTVIDACGLRLDVGSLPEGDATQIGSRGLNLSGGQRQRLVRYNKNSVHHPSAAANMHTGSCSSRLCAMRNHCFG